MSSGQPHVDPVPGASPDAQDRSLGDVVSDIATDLSTLVKQEMELARTELKQEAAKAGKGAGLLGGAGVAGHLMLIALTFTIALLLDNWMPVEVAFLIMTVVWALVAAVLAMAGRKALRASQPQLPETQQTLKEDAAWVKARKS